MKQDCSFDHKGVSRKRRRGEEPIAEISPTVDPVAAFEVLIDRLSVWYTIAELGIEMEGKRDGQPGSFQEEGIQDVLKRLWREIIITLCVQILLPRLTNFSADVPMAPDLCSSFHLKIFGRPLPETEAQPSTMKKGRKPKFTRVRLSADTKGDADTLPLARSVHRPITRPSSLAPAERPPPTPKTSRPRSVSGQSESHVSEQRRRSRSRSTDPWIPQLETGPHAGNRYIARVPSGHSLFKGRQVGLMRRTSSIVGKREIIGQDSKLVGLLGRKTSGDIKEDRKSVESEQQLLKIPPADIHANFQDRKESQSKPDNAIIFATPSKPRLANPVPGQHIHNLPYQPTPIQEEQFSVERFQPAYVTETPVTSGRVADASFLAQTLVEEDDDDPLGGLMVMTDEEDDLETLKIPATPATS